MKQNVATFLLLLTCSSLAYANDAATELAKKSQNPVDYMITVPLNSNFNLNWGTDDNTQYMLNAKPVIPFRLTANWNLITRTILPISHQPNLKGSGYINGIGDANPSLFLSPSHPGKIIWGVGPAFVLPTAGNNQLGQGKYSAGPTFVILTMPGRWVSGVVVSNVWSVGGETTRPYVNQMSLQYFINYNFDHGWYIATSPTLTSDWTQNSKNRWTIPFGGGAGKVFKIGKQAANASLQIYRNVVSPKIIGASWQVELNFSLLFPEDKA